MKYIIIEMPNGEKWEVPAETVAKNRAEHYRHESETAYEDELKYTLSDDSELIDWACNNMNWSDVKPVAKKVIDAKELSEEGFDEGWCNGEKEVMER